MFHAQVVESEKWIGLIQRLKGIGARFRSIAVEAMLSPTHRDSDDPD